MKSAAILRRPGYWGLRRGVLLLAALCVATAVAIMPARAQTDQMALEADQLVYDYDADLISAIGHVVVEYLNYVLTTDRLTYYQATARLVAVGNVHIVDPAGNVFEAAQADVTRDFRQGFVEQLYVATAEHTFFTAESSQRRDGNITEFYQATYTACEVTFNDTERPPLWRVSAARIIHNEEEKMVYFERARLEFLGVPVAFAPRLSTPDPSVTRATGFLVPEVTLSNTLGFGVGIPFFWAPAQNLDLTLTTSYFTKAGVLVEAEWRHRLRSGIYTISGAGIYQKPMAPDPRMFRGAIRTTGDFNIGRFWQFGWDGTVQTDRSFTNTVNPSTPFITSQVHLTGVLDHSYVDAHAYYFQNVGDATNPRNDQARQGVVHPVIDVEHVMPFIGGQLTYSGNFTSVSRDANDPFMFGGDTYFYGLAGVYNRLTQQLMWERRIIGPGGQVFTPFAFGRADLYFLDLDAPPPGVTTDSFAARLTGGAGIEWSWPFLIQTPRGTHIIEPVVQFVARPSEAMIGAMPNEEAQSVIFDTTDLLSLNRFSGNDRFEGGTRLVVLLRYVGQFGQGHIEAVIGESFQLAGANSYAIAGVNSIGTGTGLEGSVSNIVAALSATDGQGRSIRLSGRFDPTTLKLQRGILTASAKIGPFSASTGLIYERSIVDVEGVPGAAFLVTGSAAIQIARSWTLSGSVEYDAVAGAVVGDSIGLRYECDCATLAITYSEKRDLGVVLDRRVMFSLQLRTLGDFGLTQR
jgi:LPS-assembly protein